MDVFTDVDIFKEVVGASIRGVPVYILLADFHVKSFLTMAENQDVNIRQLKVSAHWGTISEKHPSKLDEQLNWAWFELYLACCNIKIINAAREPLIC